MPGNASMQTTVCMTWWERCPASYVDCLWPMIRRNTRRPTRLVCYTDDAAGIAPEVATFPLLPLALPGPRARRPWRKIALWAAELPITEKTFSPSSWCVNFKHSLLPRWPLNFVLAARLPAETKVVCFTGKPDPDEARDGRSPAPWHKRICKYARPTPWIAQHWCPT